MVKAKRDRTPSEHPRIKMKTPSLSQLADVCRNGAVYLKQFRALKENLKGARRAPCLSMMTPPPVNFVSLTVEDAACVWFVWAKRPDGVVERLNDQARHRAEQSCFQGGGCLTSVLAAEAFSPHETHFCVLGSVACLR